MNTIRFNGTSFNADFIASKSQGEYVQWCNDNNVLNEEKAIELHGLCVTVAKPKNKADVVEMMETEKEKRNLKTSKK
jgi:hypothetical protein